MIITAVLGCNRLPDFFTKMHAVTVGDAVGCPLVLIGIALQANTLLLSFKIVVLALILIIINPVASYILNQIALKNDLPLDLKKGEEDV